MFLLNLLDLLLLHGSRASWACFVLWNVLSGRSGAERAKDRGGGEVIPFILATAPTTHTNLIAFHSALLQTPTQKYLLP